MDEARRFLRYVIPGLSFFAQTILLLWILIPELKITSSLQADKGIGIAISALLLSGGLGFVFSMIHHALLWGSERRWVVGSVNHKLFLDRLRSRNVLCLLCPMSGDILPAEMPVDRFKSWAIVATLWHERIKSNQVIESAEPRADSLANLVHSLGAARVASFLSIFVTFLFVNLSTNMLTVAGNLTRYVGTIALSAVLLYFHHFAFKTAGLAARRVVEQVLADVLANESRVSGGPVKTHISCP